MEDLLRSGWYAVRCHFKVRDSARDKPGMRLYEERITLWQSATAEEAIALAEAEAVDYASTLDGDEYLGLAQSYELSDLPGHGAELYSLMRDSPLDSETYLDTFFSTGDEHQTEAVTDDSLG